MFVCIYTSICVCVYFERREDKRTFVLYLNVWKGKREEMVLPVFKEGPLLKPGNTRTSVVVSLGVMFEMVDWIKKVDEKKV